MSKSKKRTSGDRHAALDSERQRLFEENQQLQKDISVLWRDLAGVCGLPFPSGKAFDRWVAQDARCYQGARLVELRAAIDDLAVKHSMPRRWRENLSHLVLYDEPYPAHLVKSYGGLSWNSKDDTYRVNAEGVDLWDSEVFEHLQHLQRKATLHNDPIPQPVPIEGAAGKLDWRPVWEWYRRNPGFTQADIADALNYHQSHVRKKLAELND